MLTPSRGSIKLAFAAAAVLVLAAIVLAIPHAMTIALAGVIVSVIAALVSVEGVMLLLLCSRSSLDALRETSRFRLEGFSMNITGFMSVFVVAYGVIYLFMSRKKHACFSVFWPLFVFLGICCASIMYTPHRIGSVEDILRLSSYVMIAILVADVFDTKEKISRFVKYYFLALLIPMAVAFYQLASGTGIKAFEYNRVYGTLQHPGSYAKFMAIYFMLTIACMAATKKQVVKALLSIILAVIGFHVIIAYTRSVWVEVGLMLIPLAIYMRQKWIWAVIAVALMLFCATPMLKGRFTEEISRGTLGATTRPLTDSLQGSYRSRYMFNRFVYNNMFSRSPIVGKGAGSFFYYYSPIYFGEQVEAHGDLMKLLGETGVAGAFFFFFGFVRIIVFLWRGLPGVKDGLLSKIVAGVICLMCVKLAVMFFDAEVRLALVQWYLWALYGLCVSIITIVIPKDADNANKV